MKTIKILNLNKTINADKIESYGIDNGVLYIRTDVLTAIESEDINNTYYLIDVFVHNYNTNDNLEI